MDGFREGLNPFCAGESERSGRNAVTSGVSDGGGTMKITLDISRLVEEGKLTREEADRLTALAAHDTGSLGINILIGFGVVAIAAGAVALVPSPLTAVGAIP
jgi:hypothetical protein